MCASKRVAVDGMHTAASVVAHVSCARENNDGEDAIVFNKSHHDQTSTDWEYGNKQNSLGACPSTHPWVFSVVWATRAPVRLVCRGRSPGSQVHPRSVGARTSGHCKSMSEKTYCADALEGLGTYTCIEHTIDETHTTGNGVARTPVGRAAQHNSLTYNVEGQGRSWPPAPSRLWTTWHASTDRPRQSSTLCQSPAACPNPLCIVPG